MIQCISAEHRCVPTVQCSVAALSSTSTQHAMQALQQVNISQTLSQTDLQCRCMKIKSLIAQDAHEYTVGDNVCVYSVILLPFHLPMQGSAEDGGGPAE